MAEALIAAAACGGVDYWLMRPALPPYNLIPVGEIFRGEVTFKELVQLHYISDVMDAAREMQEAQMAALRERRA